MRNGGIIHLPYNTRHSPGSCCDLSTNASVIVIRNFINRRGLPVRTTVKISSVPIMKENNTLKYFVVFIFRTTCPKNPAECGIEERKIRCESVYLR